MIKFINAFEDILRHCAPITSSMSFGDVQVAGSTFRDLQVKNYEEALAVCHQVEDKEIYCVENALISVESLVKLLDNSEKASAISFGETLIAYNPKVSETEYKIISSCENDFFVQYSWDFLRVNETLIKSIKSEILGTVHSSAVIEGEVIIGEGTRILPGVFIEGNAIFGKNCKIGPNCYIRGSSYIGDNCHIGQSVEIKNSIIMNGSSIGHLSYCGDSIICQKVNFGAGTITSNFRHDHCNHRSMIDGDLVDTGRCKMGVIVGSGVHTGINTSFYPGRKVWPGVSTRPGDIVQRDIVEEC